MAMLVMLLLLGVLLAALRGITGSWERLTAEKARFNELLTLDRVLDGMLTSVIPFTWPEAAGQTTEVVWFIGEPDRVALVCRQGWRDRPAGRLRNLLLYVEGNELRAAYQSRPMSELGVPGPLAEVVVLARQVESLACWYAGPAGDDIEWRDGWNNDQAATGVPLAIRLDVVWLDGRRESWLRRTPGNGFYDEQAALGEGSGREVR